MFEKGTKGFVVCGTNARMAVRFYLTLEDAIKDVKKRDNYYYYSIYKSKVINYTSKWFEMGEVVFRGEDLLKERK